MRLVPVLLLQLSIDNRSILLDAHCPITTGICLCTCNSLRSTIAALRLIAMTIHLVGTMRLSIGERYISVRLFDSLTALHLLIFTELLHSLLTGLSEGILLLNL